jgi:hypothetical protein
MKLVGKKFRVSSVYWPRREFNPASAEDLNEYRYFLQKQHWKNGCPFVLEWPFLNVIVMIEHKVTRYHIASLVSSAKVK